MVGERAEGGAGGDAADLAAVMLEMIGEKIEERHSVEGAGEGMEETQLPSLL